MTLIKDRTPCDKCGAMLGNPCVSRWRRRPRRIPHYVRILADAQR